MIDNNLKKTKEILEQYATESHLPQIISLYKRLSLYSVFLGENLAQLKKEYNTAHYMRKIEVSHSYINNKKEKITDATSKELANQENAQYIQDELDKEALAMRLEIFLRQVNKVLDAMRTDISFLKGELERTKKEDL